MDPVDASDLRPARAAAEDLTWTLASLRDRDDDPTRRSALDGACRAMRDVLHDLRLALDFTPGA